MNNKDIELIESYLSDRLLKGEKEAFEQRLQQDKAFCRLFQEQKLLKEGVAFSILKDAEKQLQDLEANLPPIKSVGNGKSISFYKSKTFLGIAASLLVILVSVGVYFSNRPPDTDALFKEYFEVYPNTITNTKRSPRQDQFSEDVVEAFRYYDAGDYQSAIPLFEKIIQEDSSPDYLFYLGNAYLANGKYRNAIDRFQMYLSLNKDFEAQSYWRISLAHLKLKDFEQSCYFLNKISENDQSLEQNVNELKQKNCN